MQPGWPREESGASGSPQGGTQPLAKIAASSPAPSWLPRASVRLLGSNGGALPPPTPAGVTLEKGQVLGPRPPAQPLVFSQAG